MTRYSYTAFTHSPSTKINQSLTITKTNWIKISPILNLLRIFDGFIDYPTNSFIWKRCILREHCSYILESVLAERLPTHMIPSAGASWCHLEVWMVAVTTYGPTGTASQRPHFLRAQSRLMYWISSHFRSFQSTGPFISIGKIVLCHRELYPIAFAQGADMMSDGIDLCYAALYLQNTSLLLEVT